MNKDLLIYGAGGHGLVIADIAKLSGYENVIFYDDDLSKNHLGDYQVTHDLNKFNNYDLILAIGSNETRKKISSSLNKKLVTLIHPSAVIAKDCLIEEGVVVMANAVINSGSVIKKGTIINTSATIDHENYIDEYSHISVGVHLAGNVKVGKNCFIGIGAIVSNNITICDDVILGAASLVIKDLNEKGTYVGVPCHKIK